MTHTMEIDLELSDESIDQIIESAGYGIKYWAVAAEVDEEARTYTVTENEEGDYEKHVITYDKIVESFWKIANPGSKIKGVSQMVKGYALAAIMDGIRANLNDIDAGHVDSDLADEIIQVAIHNEVIYG